jgi:centromere protein C
MAPRAASTSAPVRRRLDFSNASFDDNENASTNYTAPQKRGGSAMPSLSSAHLMRGERLQPAAEIANSEQSDSMHDETPLLGDEDSFQLVDMGGDEDLQIPDQESEDEPREERGQSPELLEEVMSTKKRKAEAKATEVKQPTGKRGRPKKQNPPLVVEEEEEEEEEVVVVEEEEEEEEEEQLTSPVAEVTELAKKRGRPKKTALGPASPEIQIPAKKQNGASKRPAVVEEEEPSVEPRPTKKIRRSLEGSKPTKGQGKTKTAATTTNGSKSKGRKPKSATIAESNSPIVQRGPPIPRNKTGLFIVRRETPAEGIGFKKTRSGRNSIKPVNYWKGEKVEYNTDKTEDHFGGKRNFLMPTIKEVVRAEEVDQPKRARGKSKAPRSKKRAESESEDEAELDSWELEPGFINGDVRVWDPVDQIGSQAEETEVDIAFSAGAIVTTEIPGATFRFAKTLTLPFFGSGMVDLAPGGVKKRKNSRKMHMVFFVHRGRVQVTVNDTAFRIGQGGMWQVPRGWFLILIVASKG